MLSRPVLRTAAAITLLAAPVFSCSRPVSCENFILSSQAPDSVYTFTFDLYDTLQTFDLSFYSAYDRADTSSVCLEILWMNPDSVTFGETAYLPLGDPAGFEVPYRSGVSPQVPGPHTVSVHVLRAPQGFRGLGMVCRIRED